MYNPKRILDVLTRHQVYLEGLKLGKARDFNQVLQQLDKDLRELFAELRFETLDGFTKTALRNFIVALRRIQADIYSKYAEEVYGFLFDFVNADLSITKTIFATLLQATNAIIDGEKATAELEAAINENDNDTLFPFAWLSGEDNGEKLYNYILNNPIPANGILPKVFLSNFITSASLAVENLVRKGYVNGWSVNDTLNEIIGTKGANFRDGQLSRINSQNSAVIDTLLQHASSIVQAGVGSAYYGRYLWVSVLDNKTTEICRSRNGELYYYGKGPLPPAHIR